MKYVLFVADNEPAIDLVKLVAVALGEKAWESLVTWHRESPANNPIAIYIDRPSYAKRFLNNCRPDVMVMTREVTTPIQAAFMKAAKLLGIPVLFIPHGMMIKDAKAVWTRRGQRFSRLGSLRRLIVQGYRKMRAGVSLSYLIRVGIFRALHDFGKGGNLTGYNSFDRIVAYGEYMREVFIEHGVDAYKIAVTGNPRCDRYSGYNDERPRGRQVLLLTTYLYEFGMWSKEQRDSYLTDVLQATINEASLPLIIKIHPVNENPEEYRSWLRRCPIVESDCTMIFQNLPLDPLFRASDVVVTCNSSAGMEAMAAGKPLIIYNPYGDPTLYAEGCGAYFARNIDELGEAIKAAMKMSDEQIALARQFIKTQLGDLDGGAAGRIANEIVKLGGGN